MAYTDKTDPSNWNGYEVYGSWDGAQYVLYYHGSNVPFYPTGGELSGVYAVRVTIDLLNLHNYDTEFSTLFANGVWCTESECQAPATPGTGYVLECPVSGGTLSSFGLNVPGDFNITKIELWDGVSNPWFWTNKHNETERL